MSSYEEVYATVQAADTGLRDLCVHVDQLAVEADALVTGDERFQLSDTGLARLCDAFGHKPNVPSKYVASLPCELKTRVLRHHVSEGFGRAGSVRLLTRNSEVVGFARPDLLTLTACEVLEAACAGTGGQVEELDATGSGIGGETLQMDLIVRRASREVRPGDIVQAGVRVTHSLIGEHATRVEGQLLRLVCSNGMTHRECSGSRELPRTRRLPAAHPRARDQQREQVRRLTSEALDTLNRRLGGLEHLTREEVDFEPFATHWLRRSRLSTGRLMPLLRQAREEEGGEGTAYGVMNAFTRVATHQPELSPNIRRTLARLSGLLAFGHSRMCPRCWSLIAASN